MDSWRSGLFRRTCRRGFTSIDEKARAGCRMECSACSERSYLRIIMINKAKYPYVVRSYASC